ncbi:MAG: regulatory protein RecX [Bacteroidota bacterium]
MERFPSEILTKIYKYCAYQDRCYQEVIRKLRELELPEEDEEAMIEHLEAERFLDQQRFAHSFARGKFTIKRWGKHKIRHALRQKGLKPLEIEAAIAGEISDEAYYQSMHYLVEQKIRQYQGLTILERNQKIGRFLTQKGYEGNLFWEVIRSYDPPKQ